MSKSAFKAWIDLNKGDWNSRILIGTPCTGLVRMEWVLSRYGQIIPTNWSNVDQIQWMNAYAPMKYLIPDAQNLIVKSAVEEKFEWLLLLEQDNCLPPDAFIRLNQYMHEKKVPVVSGLYFTKSVPAEPLLFRGRGNSYFADWKLGEKVWVDGVPTGTLLIHCSILRAMWNDAEKYYINHTETRRVFKSPDEGFYDPQNGNFMRTTGTTDLDWCTRVIKGRYFEKAGWPRIQKLKYPFLVDTQIFVRHIDQNGVQFPIEIPRGFQPSPRAGQKAGGKRNIPKLSSRK